MSRTLLLLCTTIAATALPGCVVHHHGARGGPVVVSRPGPPPHAPAHGHGHKHHQHGVEMVFDSNLGVYVVVGSKDVFFHKDRFYRIVNGAWEITARLDGRWAAVHHGLPKGLKKVHEAKRHGKGKRQHPAKHHD